MLIIRILVSIGSSLPYIYRTFTVHLPYIYRTFTVHLPYIIDFLIYSIQHTHKPCIQHTMHNSVRKSISCMMVTDDIIVSDLAICNCAKHLSHGTLMITCGWVRSRSYHFDRMMGCAIKHDLRQFVTRTLINYSYARKNKYVWNCVKWDRVYLFNYMAPCSHEYGTPSFDEYYYELATECNSINVMEWMLYFGLDFVRINDINEYIYTAHQYGFTEIEAMLRRAVLTNK
jgi:hypothetical protein